jgi:hypothetical protein
MSDLEAFLTYSPFISSHELSAFKVTEIRSDTRLHTSLPLSGKMAKAKQKKTQQKIKKSAGTITPNG